MLTGPPPKFHGTRDILFLRAVPAVGQFMCEFVTLVLAFDEDL
jgi:hypothetical protein